MSRSSGASRAGRDSLGERPLDASGQPLRATILSGDIQNDGAKYNNAWSVVYANGVEHAVLDALTITGGYSSDGTWQQANRWLAAVCTPGHRRWRCATSITDCYASDGGGGIYHTGGDLSLEHVAFEKNSAGLGGGGLSTSAER